MPTTLYTEFSLFHFALLFSYHTNSSSGGKGPKNFGRWGSLKDKRQSSQASLASANQRGTVRHSADSDSGTECVHTFQKAALYILGEKSHMKVRYFINLHFICLTHSLCCTEKYDI